MAAPASGPSGQNGMALMVGQKASSSSLVTADVPALPILLDGTATAEKLCPASPVLPVGSSLSVDRPTDRMKSSVAAPRRRTTSA